MNTNEKIDKVKEILKDKKIAIAFSGGADSTLLCYLAKEVAEDVLAISYNNKVFPTGFVEFIKRRTTELGIKHEIIENNFLEIDDFIDNTPQRCFICRKLMYASIKQVANDKGYEIIVDGNNITDLTNDRPGILITYENNILSPFIKAGLESKEIHQYLEDNHIEYSKSTTCLATRIKTNERINENKLNRISYCENYIQNLTGMEIIKVRESNNQATIETEELAKLLNLEKIDKIKNELKNVQYDKILLNIGLNPTNEELITKNEIIEEDYQKINLNKQLPYSVNIKDTLEEIKKIENQKTLKNLGKIEKIDSFEDKYIKIIIDNKNIKLFQTGKISVNNLKNKEETYNYLIKILPLIRREL